MQQQYPKRVIEVDLPIKRISAHARREKSIRHGHISTLHIWWARRPLAACRAVICASLWFDPADPLCPSDFREEARMLMRGWVEDHRSLLGAESFEHFEEVRKDPGRINNNEVLRTLLLDFIADFANWDNSTNSQFLETSRALTQAAHLANGGEPGTRSLVVDPFAGGGAIPLEALRVGADVFASDLNPVAVLLNKVVLEYIPKYGQRLGDEVRKWGTWIKGEAEKELAEFYPSDADGATPIAYVWARTIQCEGPGCGAEVPLMRSLWLAKKGKGSMALKLVPDQKKTRVKFEIVYNAQPKDVGNPTVARGSTTCPCCGYTTPIASVRKQLKAKQGGANSARLLAIRQDEKQTGQRTFRLPTERDIEAAQNASTVLQRRKSEHTGTPSLVPDEPTPLGGGKGAGRAFSQRNYGMDRFEDLFNPRQALALSTFATLVRQRSETLAADETGLAVAVQACLAQAVDRLADYNSSLCTLNITGGRGLLHTFARNALPIIWDFTETNPFNEVGANWMTGIETILATIETERGSLNPGHVEQASATSHPLPNDAAQALVTDPPYYDAVPYSDLSDFFYVWLKRTLPSALLTSFAAELSPKAGECILDDAKGMDQAYFERTMQGAMSEGRRVLAPNGIGVVVFAHKSTAGWEAHLQALISAGWIITGSWPIDTERAGRLRAMDSAALASSVHLVCRPRENPDGSVRTDEIGDWRDVLQELPRRIHEWMPRLANEGVVGADAIFACLGPALEVFSRYARVEKASGEQVTLREYLEYVWAAVGQEALNMIFVGADATGFEEDARVTAMWLWTLFAGATNGNQPGDEVEEEGTEESDDGQTLTKSGKPPGFVLEYDAARKIAQGLGARLETMPSLVEVKGDRARLLPVAERTKYLFGKDEAEAPTKRRKKEPQGKLFEIIAEAESDAGGWSSKSAPKLGDTVLDRIHQSMILFAANRSEALKRFLVDDGAGSDERFWRLAQALVALYPKGTDERRWIEGVTGKKKGLGF